MGFETLILCVAFYFKGTQDICLGHRTPDRLAQFPPHLKCLQGMHLDPSHWTSNYALIILINSLQQDPSWQTKVCWASKKKLFYNIGRFVIALKASRHLSISWATSIQSTLSRPVILISVWIPSCHQRPNLLSSLFTWGFPNKILHEFPFPHSPPTYLVWFNLRLVGCSLTIRASDSQAIMPSTFQIRGCLRIYLISNT